MILAISEPPESLASWCSKKILSASMSGRDLACAQSTALIGTCAAHILVDGVDLGNARNGFGGDRRIAALGDLEELAP